jgi:acetamidase/formamidase
MTVHRIEPAPESTVNVFSAEHEPLLAVDAEDTIIIRSLEARGYLERHEFPGDVEKPRMFSGDFRGHCLHRPIAVRGAVSGDMLAVEVVSLTPETWGWTVTPTAPDSAVLQRLGLIGVEPVSLLWEIDNAAGVATGNGKYTRPIAPFLGVIGVALSEAGEHSTVPSRTKAGGNIDCNELVAGSTLYLPVNTDGALLYLGDGHAAQGDGESCGTAIEVVVRIAPGRPLASVHAETPAGKIVFGFSSDLNEAVGDALDVMVTWLAAVYGDSRAEALALVSTSVDLRITQIANVTWGVHALLPAGLLTLVTRDG